MEETLLSLASGLLGPFVPGWDDFDFSHWATLCTSFARLREMETIGKGVIYRSVADLLFG